MNIMEFRKQWICAYPITQHTSIIILKHIPQILQSMQTISIFKFSSIPSKYFLDTTFKNATAVSFDAPGALTKLCQKFAQHNVNLSYLRTHFLNHKKKEDKKYVVDISYESKDSLNFQKAKIDLQKEGVKIYPNAPIKIPWFPRKFEDLDKTGKILHQVKQSKNHTQFQDQQYRKRRDYLAQIALQYKLGQKIPQINYTPEQTDLWIKIYKKLSHLHRTSMCQKFIKQTQALNKELKVDERIPQLSELSDYLYTKTGFRIKPVHGVLCQRQFLNSFAFKVFCSTQYIRNTKNPDYTPQPDIVHQIIGHVPMFADPEVAQISHIIGLLSLGASDEQIAKLGTLYWYTLQFGVCKQNGKILGYGAGVASSVGQINHMLSTVPKFQKLNILRDCTQPYPMTTVQPVFKYTESFEQSIKDLQRYGRGIMKPISTIYNEKKQQIEYDRNIEALTTI